MEIIGAICAIIGVLFLIYQFGILPGKEDREIKTGLLVLYNTNQRLIDELIDRLNEISKSNRDVIYFGNLSVEGYIEYLKDLREKELNDELFKKIESQRIPKAQCSIMLHSLQKQQESFNSSMMYIKINFKNLT